MINMEAKDYIYLAMTSISLITAIFAAIAAWQAASSARDQLNISLLSNYGALRIIDTNIIQNVRDGTVPSRKLIGLWLGLRFQNLGTVPVTVYRLQLIAKGRDRSETVHIGKTRRDNNMIVFDGYSEKGETIAPSEEKNVGGFFFGIFENSEMKSNFEKPKEFILRVSPANTPPVEFYFKLLDQGGTTQSKKDDRSALQIISEWYKEKR